MTAIDGGRVRGRLVARPWAPARRGRRPPALLVAAGVLLALVLAPTGAVIGLALGGGDAELWPHLAAYVLPQALADTGVLLLGVGALALVLGAVTAALVAMTEFPGRGLFAWALLLPLAMPTYIVAYTYVEILDPLGPVQSAVRALFGYTARRDYLFPEIRSMGGAILLMALVLYPYVYLTVRATLQLQSSCVLDVARTLGLSRRAAFLRIGLPLARPALVLGATLVGLEALNDIGATEHLGVRSLAVAISTTWLNKGSLAGAAQIACVALAFVVVLLSLERIARRGQRYVLGAQRARPIRRVPLRGWQAVAAFTACAVPVLGGFVVPAAWLAATALTRSAPLALGQEAAMTLALAVGASLVTVGAGFLVATAARGERVLGTVLVRLAGLGYALPGTVLAIGVLAPLAALDNAVDAFLRAHLGVSTGLLLTGTVAALLFAYTVRFLAITAGGIDSGYAKISPSLDMAARSLGRGAAQTAAEIHLPLLRPAIAAAALLVFVDTMKELPATLLLRPFGLETLATYTYAQAARGVFEDGAGAALMIVAAGIVPVILLGRAGFADPEAVRRPRRPGSPASAPDHPAGGAARA